MRMRPNSPTCDGDRPLRPRGRGGMGDFAPDLAPEWARVAARLVLKLAAGLLMVGLPSRGRLWPESAR